LTALTGLVYVSILFFDRWWKHKPFDIFKRPKAPQGVAEDPIDLRKF
jgi:hypothetical protein